MIRVVVVGNEWSGKTSLVRALQKLPLIEGDPTGSGVPQLEISNVTLKAADGGGHEIELADANFGRYSGGRGDWATMNLKNYEGAHVAIYCKPYNAIFDNDAQFSRTFLPEIREAVPWAGVVVAQTKVDARTAMLKNEEGYDSMRAHCETKRQRLLDELEQAGIPNFFDVSAKDGTGIEALGKAVLQEGEAAIGRYAAWSKKKKRKHREALHQKMKEQERSLAAALTQYQPRTKQDCTIL